PVNDTHTTPIYTLSLHDALPISESNLGRTRKLITRAAVPIDELSSAKELSTLFIQLGKYSETDKLLNKLIEEYQRVFGPNSIRLDRKSTRLNSSHVKISYAVFCL